MNFRTEISTANPGWQINYPDEIIFLGSCFSSAIGEKMAESKFPVSINPFGTVYNPLSITYLLNFSLGFQNFRPPQLIKRENTWYSLDCASQLYGDSPASLEEKFLKTGKELESKLRSARALFLSLGTARVHRAAQSGILTANRHKQPENQFSREWLSPEEIAESILEVFGRIRSINPEMKMILTVSPVRHLAEGMEVNAISKSILRYACHLLCEASIREDSLLISYFPAYEILLDDLRDYGFYADDLVHPSNRAENYIWEKFADAYLSTEAKNILAEWNAVKAALNHKPFRTETTSRKKLITNLLGRLSALKTKMNVGEEIRLLNSELESYQ